MTPEQINDLISTAPQEVRYSKGSLEERTRFFFDTKGLEEYLEPILTSKIFKSKVVRKKSNGLYGFNDML